MYVWSWLERPTAELLFDWEKANEQLVYEAISQASEFLISVFHDNVKK
jgi:hypothetical protein